MPAAPAARGDAEEAAGRPGWFGIVVQVGLMYVLYQQFFSGGKTASAPAAAVGGRVSADEFTASTPLPTPASASSAPAGGLSSFFSLPATGQTHSSLEWLEASRKASVRSASQMPGARGCLWPDGQSFDLWVFLSTEGRPRLSFDDNSDALSAKQAVLVPPSGSGGYRIPSLSETFHDVLRKGFLTSVFFPRDNHTDTATPAPQAPAWDALVEAEQAGREVTGLLWRARGLRFEAGASSNGSLVANVSLPQSVRRDNGTLFAHIVLARSRSSVRLADTESVLRIAYPVVFHRPKRRAAELRSLVEMASGGNGDMNASAMPEASFGIGHSDTSKAGQSSVAADDTDTESSSGLSLGQQSVRPVLPYWRPALHIASVAERGGMNPAQLPPFVGDHIWFSSGGAGYHPITVVNDWWLLAKRLVEINETVTEAPLEVSWEALSMMYWAAMTQWTAQQSMQSNMGLATEADAELTKQMVLETNPWLLGLTIVVSTLHMVFDFLAFRSDISFWRRAKTMEGLSVKTIMLNVFFQTVILLYLFDNDTSWMILASSCVGLAIEVWKLRKAIAFSIVWNGSWPTLQMQDKDDGYVKSKTKMYDDMAMTHLGAVLYPLVVGYALFSLFYARHRSWYSWILSSLVGFVYAFGFILMTPQLFINYKLKSVAHMPWRAMVYKALNTFIDDLFAFIITAPIMHRLSTFRDDIVFFIYLYQRWIYPVDMKRTNEFGTSGDDVVLSEERARGIKRASRRDKGDRRLFVPLHEQGRLSL